MKLPQNPRMLGAGRALCGSPSPTPCPSRVTQSSCTAPRPGGAGISPEKETPQPPWDRAPSPSEGEDTNDCHTKGTSPFTGSGLCPDPHTRALQVPSRARRRSPSQAAGRAPGSESEPAKASHGNLKASQLPSSALSYSGKACTDSGPETLYVD